MSHIECTGPKNNKYLRIANDRKIPGSGGKHKKDIIKNLGPLKEWDDGKPNFLERLRKQYQTMGIIVDGVLYKKELPQKRYQFNIPFSNTNPLLLSSAEFYNYGYVVLDTVLSSLQLNKHLCVYKHRHRTSLELYNILRLLVLSRILKPDSKLGTFEFRDDFFGNPFANITDVKDIYRALDVFSTLSSSIQNRINTSITNSTIGRRVDLIYYDVTNYYFETMHGDEDILAEETDSNGNPIVVKRAIRKKGVSKENRSEPIVQMGLFIDQNGIPISFDIFPGSMHDQMTFSEMIASHHLPMNLGRVVVVADNGMHNQYNLKALVDNGDGYIVSKSLRKAWRSLRSFVLDEDGYMVRHADQNDNVTFKYKSKIYERTLMGRDGKTITVREKMVVFWSKAHAEADAKANVKFMEYLETCKIHPEKFKDKTKVKRFFKQVQKDKATGNPLAAKDKVEIVYELDEAKIKAMQETYGYYAIVTSEIDEPDIDIINRYHNLSRIEDSFRITKSDLEGRPVYVRTEEHIRAHFLICFIALVVIRLVQYKYEKMFGDDLDEDYLKGKHRHWQQSITAERLQEVLRGLRVATDENGICLFDAKKKDQQKLERLFDCLGTKFDINTPTVNEVRRLQMRLKKNFKL